MGNFRCTTFTNQFVLFFVIFSFSAVAPRPGFATEYRFRLACENQDYVVLWKTGDLDPGREYLRIVTGTNNPSCSIADYNDASDSHLYVDVNEGPTAIVKGIPFVGKIISEIFWK
jgi:hypothetical protein